MVPASARSNNFSQKSRRDSGSTARLEPFSDASLFPGFVYGYNRSILAERVLDTFSLLQAGGEMDRSHVVDLIGFGGAGPWALLALAMVGDEVRRAAIDLDGFDFDRVKTHDDENMLPGVVRYGGIHGFVPLVEAETTLFGVRDAGRVDLSKLNPRVKPAPDSVAPSALVESLLKGA